MTEPANPYPVDSAPRPCCGGIGAHTQGCQAARDGYGPPPNPPLPAGADPERVGAWELLPDCNVSRTIWSNRESLPGFDSPMHDITVSASQRLDGSLASEGPDQPMISTGFGELKPNIARYLAGLLILAADQADTWAGRPVAADVIAAADGEV